MPDLVFPGLPSGVHMPRMPMRIQAMPAVPVPQTGNIISAAPTKAPQHILRHH